MVMSIIASETKVYTLLVNLLSCRQKEATLPKGQSFTRMCQQLARLAQPKIADLHLHTTFSDGDYTLSQLLAKAKQARLKSIAITDHDTYDAFNQIPMESQLNFIPGIELTATHHDRELHLLAYHFDRDNTTLKAHCNRMMEARRRRFDYCFELLAQRGIVLPAGMLDIARSKVSSLGRRHVAKLLIQTGLAPNNHVAFHAHILPISAELPRDHLRDVQSLATIVHDAGGILLVAHPAKELDCSAFAEFQQLGVDGIEVDFPSASYERSQELRRIATDLGMVVSGGSDCHGPDNPNRTIGSCGVTQAELDQLHQRATSSRPNSLRLPNSTIILD